MHGSAVPMAVTSASPSAGNSTAPPTDSPPHIMRRTSSDDETRRGGDRPTLPPIRHLFGRELSQPPHPNAPDTSAHYSPSSHFQQLALPDEPAYHGEQGRSGYVHSHGHAQASSHSHLRPLTAQYHASQRSQLAAHASPAQAARSFAPFQTELHDATRSIPSNSSRPGYKPESHGYKHEPPRTEEPGWGVYARESAHGTAAYSYPPPPPPLHQNYVPGSSSRAPPPGYHYPRQMASSYSASSSIIPSGLVAPEQPSAKYECQYCGKGFTRPSSLKIHVHSHTGERPFKCTFEGCNRTFSVQSNMRRHARTHLQAGNEAARESEGDEESEEGSPQPRQGTQQAAEAIPR